jgi:hypothetical protein
VSGQFDLIEILPHKEIGKPLVRDLRLKTLKDRLQDLPVLEPQVSKFWKSSHVLFFCKKMEAANGFEPMNNGFADRCLSLLATPPLTSNFDPAFMLICLHPFIHYEVSS